MKGFSGGSAGKKKKKTCLTMQETQETQIQCLGQEDPLEKEMATHSSVLAWKITWRGEPGGPQSMGHKELYVTEHTRPQACSMKEEEEILKTSREWSYTVILSSKEKLELRGSSLLTWPCSQIWTEGSNDSFFVCVQSDLALERYHSN